MFLVVKIEKKKRWRDFCNSPVLINSKHNPNVSYNNCIFRLPGSGPPQPSQRPVALNKQHTAREMNKKGVRTLSLCQDEARSSAQPLYI